MDGPIPLSICSWLFLILLVVALVILNYNGWAPCMTGDTVKFDFYNNFRSSVDSVHAVLVIILCSCHFELSIDENITMKAPVYTALCRNCIPPEPYSRRERSETTPRHRRHLDSTTDLCKRHLWRPRSWCGGGGCSVCTNYCCCICGRMQFAWVVGWRAL